MGLDVSHDCFHGAYSAFNRFRQSVARACGGSFPPHDEDFRRDNGSIPDRKTYYWNDDGIPEAHHAAVATFLGHEDCDGTFTPTEAAGVAEFLRWAAPKMNEEVQGHLSWATTMGDVAIRFANGCARAANADEDVEFS